MFRPIRAALALVLVLLAGPVRAETLPLPDRLVDLRSDRGEAFLLESDDLDAYLPISSAFETQKTQAYCGVASIVMTLNALRAPAPTSPEYKPFTVFTQDNVLDEATDAVLPRSVLARQGMTLDQLGALLALHPVTVAVQHAEPGGLDAFRTAARETLGRRGGVVVVNYLRKAIDQERGGHISPLGAYDAKADRVLILDVARYKYPPVWVTAADLYDAMNTVDADNEGRTRGYVVVSGPPTAGP